MSIGALMIVAKSSYTIEQDFALEPRMHRQRILPILAEASGLDPTSDDLLVAQVIVSCANYAGRWNVRALVCSTVVGSIRCAKNLSREDVLNVAESWIRASEHVTFVPGCIYEIPIENPDHAKYVVQGLILVRGDQL